MLASLPTRLATLSMTILIATLAFKSSAYATPVPASVDATPAADIIQIDERHPPFVNTVLSRRADTPAKPETGDRVWHYRR
ncbi:hypothetical protein BGX30_000146 [Mortierella sp. GBA39]|nr:hypothetical protein BGX30_000146 [Mortierella sp. GBA39]